MNVHLRMWFALLVSLIIFRCDSRAFAQSNLDSLKGALYRATIDTEKVNILQELALETGCEDTIQKLAYANQAKNLAEKIRWTDGIIKSNMCLGALYYGFCLKNYERALTYYLQADTLAIANKNRQSEILSLFSIAAIYQKVGKYKQAIDYYRHILTLNPDADNQMGAWGNLGVEYNSLGDYNQALSSYYNSLKVIDSLQRTKKVIDVQDTVQMAALLLNIGDVYIEMAQPDKALTNYDSVYKLGVVTNYQLLQVVGLMGVGEVYLIKKSYEQSIQYYQKALTACYGQNTPMNEVKILNKLANAYLGNGELKKAMEFAQNSLALAQEKSIYESMPKTYITLGKIYAEQKEYTSAANYMQKALTISKQTGALDDEKDAWYALSNTYGLMNLPAKALDAYKNFITIRDSVYNIAKANEITRQELDFKYLSKQQADQLNYEQKIARQQIYTYAGFAGLCLVILLSFFIYRNYNTQKKYNELLSREKKRHLEHIEAQDTVLSDIAHIQAHQVRGPVATILGLVQIFNHDDATDPVNKEIIEGLVVVTEKLDTVVKEVILKENKLKSEQSIKDDVLNA